MRIIAGKVRGLTLATPKDLRVRPTADRVKESVFNILGPAVQQAKVLDLFAGSGNLGLECFSRGAAFVTFVDNSRESLALVKKNIAKCRAEERCRTVLASSQKAVERFHRQGERFDLVFCDPPYNQGHVAAVLAALGQHSFLAEAGCLILERSAHEELPELAAPLVLVREVKYGETIVDFIKNFPKEKG